MSLKKEIYDWIELFTSTKRINEDKQICFDIKTYMNLMNKLKKIVGR